MIEVSKMLMWKATVHGYKQPTMSMLICAPDYNGAFDEALRKLEKTQYSLVGVEPFPSTEKRLWRNTNES